MITNEIAKVKNIVPTPNTEDIHNTLSTSRAGYPWQFVASMPRRRRGYMVQW